MSRWIDADAIDIRAREGYAVDGVLYLPYRDIRKSLDSAPSIDIVRCRECKHWCKGDEVYGICYRCPNTRQMRYDDFCSYGERSEKPNNSTISKMEQVETMSCAECNHRPIGAEICEEPCHYEPQTDWHYDEQDAAWYPYKHEDEPQTERSSE